MYLIRELYIMFNFLPGYVIAFFVFNVDEIISFVGVIQRCLFEALKHENRRKIKLTRIVGACGSEHDATVFRKTSFGKAIEGLDNAVTTRFEATKFGYSLSQFLRRR